MKHSLQFGFSTRVQRFMRRLWCDQKGAVAPMLLVSATVIFGASLGAIDLARYTAAKSRLQTSLDSAALAAGRLATINPNGDLLAEAKAYFNANYPPGYLGSDVGANLSLVQSADAEGGTLTLTLDGTLPLVSTGFLKVSSLGLKSTSAVRLPGVSGIEVVFALDKGEHNSQNKLDTAALTLAQLLMEQGQGASATARPGVFVGVVPFSDTVNVGADANTRHWVARWTQALPPSTEKLAEKLLSTNPHYVRDGWMGCIAEPQPWATPPRSVGVLSPDASFQPLFVRVKTAVNDDNSNKDGALRLPNQNYQDFYQPGDLIKLDSNSAAVASSDRRLWAKYLLESPGNSNNAKNPTFRVHGAFEPQGCHDKFRVRFLTDHYVSAGQIQGVKQTLSNLSGGVSVPGKSLLPVGLLWSWRMLHPNWRNSKGWPALGSAGAASERTRQAIVLFSSGNNTTWGGLAEKPANGAGPGSAYPWAVPSRFSFKFTYKDGSTPQPTLTQPAFEITRNNTNAQQWFDDVQWPVTSLAMANPFDDDQKPAGIDTSWDTQGGSMATYTKGICDAIKAQTTSNAAISIYVVDMNANGSGGSASAAKDELIHCASESKVYAASTVDLTQLRDRILQDISTSDRLRLIR